MNDAVAGQREVVEWCPACRNRGVEPVYGPHFDHDGDNMPTGWKPCHRCRREPLAQEPPDPLGQRQRAGDDAVE